MTSFAGGTELLGLPERGLRVGRRAVSRYVARQWDVRPHGQENVPATGPVILASNHIGWLDGPLLVARAPRPAHALIKNDMFDGRIGHLLRATGQIKISRTEVDSGALRTASRALTAGQCIVIYPEGKRGAGEFKRFKGGVAWLALVTGAPIVPVTMFGTREKGEVADVKPPRGRRIDIVYGEPLQLPMQEWPRNRDMLDDAGEKILHHLRAHVTWSKDVLKRDLPGPLPRGSSDG